MLRIGLGYDIHPVKKGLILYLGGCEFPHLGWGLEGHSDGDVILHALSDALLGASSLEDIGKYFPPDKKSIKGISSKVILKKVKQLLDKKKFSIVNVDIVVISRDFRISLYREKIIKSISSVLKIPSQNINIKGKSNQGLGILGKGKAIGCICVCLIKKR